MKILDFGLARPSAQVVSGATLTQAPLTDPGTVLGTVGYMAPEQIRGLEVDGRADLFALGVVLYEMLTGARAFARETTADTLTAVLKEEPPELATTRAELTPALDRIVRHCLEKNPTERFQSARDVVFALESLSGSGSGQQRSTESATTGRSAAGRFSWIAAAVALIGAAGATGFWIASERAPMAPAETVRFTIPPPAGMTFRDIAVSPDGRAVAFRVYDAESQRLLVRRLDDDKTTEIDGAVLPAYPFWSADSRTLFFCDSGSLRATAVSGGALRVIAPCVDPWTSGVGLADGSIIFVPHYEQPAVHLNPESGAVIGDTPWRAPKDTIVRQLHSLDDRRFMVTVKRVGRDPGASGIYLAERGQSEQRLLVPGVSLGVAVIDQHLLYLRGDVLVAQPFNASSAQLTGTSRDLAQPVSHFSAAPNGTIAAFSSPRGLDATRRITIFARDGKEVGTLGPTGFYVDATISPDGGRVAVGRDWVPWTFDVRRGVGSPASPTLESGNNPVWSRDGKTLATIHISGMFMTSVGEGSSRAFPQSHGGMPLNPLGWSADGQLFAYQYVDGDAVRVMLLKDGQQASTILLSKKASSSGCVGRFSPVGGWLAYDSIDSGRVEVYLRPVSPPGPAILVSPTGGECAVWRPDGGAIFYQRPDRMLVEMPVRFQGAKAEFGEPRPLFVPKGAVKFNHLFDVTPDGQRFVIITESDPDPSPITMIVNWRTR